MKKFDDEFEYGTLIMDSCVVADGTDNVTRGCPIEVLKNLKRR